MVMFRALRDVRDLAVICCEKSASSFGRLRRDFEDGLLSVAGRTEQTAHGIHRVLCDRLSWRKLKQYDGALSISSGIRMAIVDGLEDEKLKSHLQMNIHRITYNVVLRQAGNYKGNWFTAERNL